MPPSASPHSPSNCRRKMSAWTCRPAKDRSSRPGAVNGYTSTCTVSGSNIWGCGSSVNPAAATTLPLLLDACLVDEAGHRGHCKQELLGGGQF
jgi:hypothetical protein